MLINSELLIAIVALVMSFVEVPGSIVTNPINENRYNWSTIKLVNISAKVIHPTGYFLIGSVIILKIIDNIIFHFCEMQARLIESMLLIILLLLIVG